ncbi:hypothetical protein BpHYR1_028801 [Brachionus plicatilis]|uniref:Uncharacterized protein n=1 Tax=Brachionus plicatilis TaxID=10195 RepID=A0A3M7P9S9_BRAPC|nr:hypothetical protein BpHYR1_028801 [Brachionus plicatilis]
MLAQMNHSNMSEMISRVFEICVRKRFVILKMNIGVSKFYTYILMILTTMADNKIATYFVSPFYSADLTSGFLKSSF